MGYYFYIYNDKTINIKFKSKNKIFENKYITQLNNVLLNELNDYIDIDNLPTPIQAILRATEYIDNGVLTRERMATEQFVKEQVALCEHNTHILRGDFNELKKVYKNQGHNIDDIYRTLKDFSMLIDRNKNVIQYFEESYNCFRNNYYKSYDLIIKGLVAIGIGITIILGLVVIYVK